MRILLANDDGVLAPGLEALHHALSPLGHCEVVAPTHDMSGASSALTLDRPLHPARLDNGFIAVNGTPTDCVHLGLNALFDEPFDVVASGVNLGANLGDDVIYSGTVGAAIEGRFTGHPAFAFSLVSRHTTHLATAGAIAASLLARHADLALPPRTVLNVNIPDLPLAELRGIKLTRLGHRRRAKPPVRQLNPRGKEGYWIAAAGDVDDGGEGTDFLAIAEGYVSVTPLQLDRTQHPMFGEIRDWLGGAL
mgnify:CR=1 FL=1